MKRIWILLLMLFAFIYPTLNAQDILKDTTLANLFFARASKFESSSLYDSAITNAVRAQSLYIRYFGDKSIKNANVLHQLGRLYWRKADYPKAIDCNLKSLNIRKELLGEDHPDVARSYNNLGVVFSETGDYEKSLGYHFKTLEMRKKLLGEEHPDISLIYENIGGVFQNLKQFDKALEYYRQALLLNVKAFGEKNQASITDYRIIADMYYSMNDLPKALEYYLKVLMLRKALFGEKHLLVATSCNSLGTVYCTMGEYDKALEYFNNALGIVTSALSSSHKETASAYNNIALVYVRKGEYNKALEYNQMALDIYIANNAGSSPEAANVYGNMGVALYEEGDYERSLKNLMSSVSIIKALKGENDNDIAGNYINIGNVYMQKGDYARAIDFFSRAVQIKINISGEKNEEVSSAYNNIGIAYMNMGEYFKGLEYYSVALQIRKAIFGENHPFVAQSYNNIGNIYSDRGDFDMALEYHNKALKAYLSVLGENHPDVAACYGNIGSDYLGEDDFNKALENFFRALKIQKIAFGENHPTVATTYNNIGNAFSDKNMTDSALIYHTRSLNLRLELLGVKHPHTASSYNNIGTIYSEQGKYELALNYFQKGELSCSAYPSDDMDIYSLPSIKNSLDWIYHLQSLMAQARIFGDRNISLKGISPASRKRITIAHYLACDSLIDITRRKINSQNDKLALGEISNKVYVNAIDFLTGNGEKKYVSKDPIPAEDLKMAFYFSEKNKSAVLLEALAGQEAQKYAGIPDSLLRIEKDLKTDIAFYSRLIEEEVEPDGTHGMKYQQKLFQCNNAYDSLITVFEKKFPEYYDLKYSTRVTTIKDVQKILDSQTALVSYVLGDSSITVFTITRKKISVGKIPAIANFEDSIKWLRYGLTKSSPRMQNIYLRLGYTFFRQFFPDYSLLKGKVTNLVIIPDGRIATLPFEALLTERYVGNIDAYNEYPFLVKEQSISYSYSADLFCRNSARRSFPDIETTNLNDWLAFAPVFDDTKEANSFMASRELQKQLDWYQSDTMIVNRSMFDRSYISPLPATKIETETVFRLMDDMNLKARVLLHNNASESALKAGASQDYRMIHFATHGFVNAEKPELSGLILAPDSAGKDDGILYCGEIYNLYLQADLVVLSACETGLGKIQRGEGIIGLTRALLYAGARNIIVSLWQVADESTSDLMVDFYRNCLRNVKTGYYSEALRNAKLKMISETKYAHPYFWSPFILVGR